MGTSSNFGNMFSMAGAALFLPFLPMLPIQILLNNLLYDISEVPIPLDEGGCRGNSRPTSTGLELCPQLHALVIGPISSVFDFLTFYILLAVLQAGTEKLFQTGWFVESLVLATPRVLVIFIIRTRGQPTENEPPPSGADGNLAGGHVTVAGGVAVYADRSAFRICATAWQVLFHPRGHGAGLSFRC